MGFLDMFDKLDDIVYEPVKLICDWAKQPLKVADKKLDFKIEERRKRLDLELSELAKNQEFERNSKIVEAIKRYQLDLGETAVKIAECVGSMSLALQERAYKLIDDRTVSYKKIQDEAIENAKSRLIEIEEKFPTNGMAKEIMEKAVEKQMCNIIDTADEFIKLMQQDLAGMTTEIRGIAKKAIENSDKYLAPMNVAGKLVDGESEKLIEEK